MVLNRARDASIANAAMGEDPIMMRNERAIDDHGNIHGIPDPEGDSVLNALDYFATDEFYYSGETEMSDEEYYKGETEATDEDIRLYNQQRRKDKINYPLHYSRQAPSWVK